MTVAARISRHTRIKINLTKHAPQRSSLRHVTALGVLAASPDATVAWESLCLSKSLVTTITLE
jgi:hypothetical protein